MASSGVTFDDSALTPLITGTFNSRDLGGLRAGEGAVRSGLLFRSDALIGLETEGRATLRALGVRTAIDLRHPVERELDPPDLDRDELDTLDVPVIEAALESYAGTPIADLYRHFLGDRGSAFAAAAQALARPGALPAVFFCSAGKDRTGLLAALILGAVGVSDEDIIAEYHLTERNLSDAFRAGVVARAHAAGVSEQETLAQIGAPRELMAETLRWLRSRYGGPAEHLLAHGLSEAELGALRRALVAPRGTPDD